MVKVWGYLIDDDVLVRWGIKQGYGTDDTPDARENVIFLAGTELMCRAEVFGHARFTGAFTKDGQVATCIALACDDPLNWLEKPDRAKIDKLKQVLNTTNEPRWYRF